MFFVFRGFLLRPGVVRGSCGLATRCAQGSEARGLIGSRAKTSAAREHSRHKCTTMTLYCPGAGDPFPRTPTMTHHKDPNRWWIRRVLAVGIERRKILENHFQLSSAPLFFLTSSCCVSVGIPKQFILPEFFKLFNLQE